MSEYYIPKFPITDELVNSQFIEVPNINLTEENVIWSKYLDVQDAIIKEKFNRFNGIEIAFNVIIRWVTIDKTSKDYQDIIPLLTSTLNSLYEEKASEEDSYDHYMNANLKNLKFQIKLYEQYFDAVHTLERKKFKYALEFRNASRSDLDVEAGFSGNDVLHYLNSLVKSNNVYDSHITEIRSRIGINYSNKYIKEALKLLINSAEYKKSKHLDEVEYYKNLFETQFGTQFGAQFETQFRAHK
jgi:hypothetical protein